MVTRRVGKAIEKFQCYETLPFACTPYRLKNYFYFKISGG